MHIKFYSILGKFEDVENFLKNIVNELRDVLRKHGGNPEKISLTLIRIRNEVINDIFKFLKEEDESKIPQNLRYLILMLKQDSITNLPAIIVNGRKIVEGELIPQEELKVKIEEEFEKEFNIKLKVEEKIIKEEVIEVPLPKPIQQTQITPIAETQVTEVKPHEVKPTLTEVKKEIEKIQTPKYTISITYGKPSNCSECIYYAPLTRYCALLGIQISDIHRPPCKRE